MKAVQYSRYGGPDVLEVVDISKPNVGKGQVLVEVRAASINPFDFKVRTGYLKDAMPLKFPVTICGDLAGVVVGIGDGVGDFKVGDEVYGQAAVYGGGSGSFAQFAVAAVGKVAIKPKNIDFVEAASLPLVGISAVQALLEHIKLQKKQKILIHGGAGGIGSIAVQIAKAVGAYVATTVGTDDVDFAKELGADQVIDYRQEDFSEKVSGFDAVFDTVGGDTTDKSFKVLKKGLPAGRQGGILVSMVGQPGEDLAKQYGVVAIGQSTDGTTEKLNKLRGFIEKGGVKPIVDKVFPLDEARAAFIHQEQNHPRGKVVVKVKN